MNALPPGALRPQGAQAISVLAALPPGSPVVAAIDGREEVLFLGAVKRSRFDAEHPDGRRLSVPFDLFLRVHDGPPPPRTPPEEARTRALIRALASRSPVGPALDLAGRGAGIVPLLLDELARAFDRIEKARGGPQPLSPTEPARKASPRDLALAEAIPLVACSIARAGGLEEVQAIAERHADARVRGVILPHLGRRQPSRNG